MKIQIKIWLFVLSVLVSASGMSRAETRRNATLMISEGEASTCQLGNISATAIVRVTDGKRTQYVDFPSSGSCFILPLKVLTEEQIFLSGVIQETTAIPNEAFSLFSTVSGCFNVEVFSVGLKGSNGSQSLNPQDAANIINDQGFGFAYFDTDSSLKPGPYSYTVVGCNGPCPDSTTYFNTDPIFTGANGSSCKKLRAFP
jgi:hypothetical protein